MIEATAQQPLLSQRWYTPAVSDCGPVKIGRQAIVATGPSIVRGQRNASAALRTLKSPCLYHWDPPAASNCRSLTKVEGVIVGRAAFEARRRAPPLAPATKPFSSNAKTALELGQFYTREDLAAYYWRVFKMHFDPRLFLMVEPSAGKGAFFKLLPSGSLGFDIVPRWPGIKKADFLNEELPRGRRIAVIGNPPYGKRSGLARRFFNRAARWASVIALILPRSFKKAGIQDQLDRRFHLLHEESVPDNAFVFEGLPRDVPTVFQIWVVGDELRALEGSEKQHPDFEFTGPEGAHFTVRRIGANAGRIGRDLSVSRSSHHFVRVLRGDVEEIIAIMQHLEFTSVSGNVVGQRSLAQSEIVSLYRDHCRAGF